MRRSLTLWENMRTLFPFSCHIFKSFLRMFHYQNSASQPYELTRVHTFPQKSGFARFNIESRWAYNSFQRAGTISCRNPRSLSCLSGGSEELGRSNAKWLDSFCSKVITGKTNACLNLVLILQVRFLDLPSKIGFQSLCNNTSHVSFPNRNRSH